MTGERVDVIASLLARVEAAEKERDEAQRKLRFFTDGGQTITVGRGWLSDLDARCATLEAEIKRLLAFPRWVSIGSVDSHAELPRISRAEYDRLIALAAATPPARCTCGKRYTCDCGSPPADQGVVSAWLDDAQGTSDRPSAATPPAEKEPISVGSVLVPAEFEQALRDRGAPIRCCEHWPECSHMLDWYGRHERKAAGS